MHFDIKKCHLYSNVLIHYCQWYSFALTSCCPSFIFSVYLLIPSKELLAKSITPLVGLVTTPTRPLPIPETDDAHSGETKIAIMARNIYSNEFLVNLTKTFSSKQKLVLNDSYCNVLNRNYNTFEETFHTFLLSALYWLTDNSCNSIKNTLAKTTFLSDNVQVLNNTNSQ